MAALAAWQRFQLPQLPANERLLIALGIAASVHALALFGLRFVDEPRPEATPTLEVTLSQFSEAPPKKADFAAPTNQNGSGDAERVTEMTTTQVSDFAADHATPLPEQRVDKAANAARDQLRPLTVDRPNAAGEPAEAHEDTTPGANASAQRPYLDVARQLATLQARLDDTAVNQALGPRTRRITSVSTLATDEAYYVNAWRREVEQIGNLNYPGEARARGIHGSVRMLVAINADGSLREAQVLESSGYPVLDQAALSIVRLAAPFPAFPESMRKRTEVLEIIRTWMFRRVGPGGGDFSG